MKLAASNVSDKFKLIKRLKRERERTNVRFIVGEI